MAFNKAKALQEAEKSVAQGKISQAIKQYTQIIEKDPDDLVLMNTLGDLYLRDKNLKEALNQFYKLAGSFMQEGFTVKAIAIYRKISKVASNTAEPLLKMAELYQTQGLGREAREQYTNAFEFFKKTGKNAQALDVIRKVVGLDPTAVVPRVRLAEFAEKLGEKKEAAEAYLAAAEVALAHGDEASMSNSLAKAAALAPEDSRLHLLQAKLALRRKAPAEAEKILVSSAGLKDNLAAKKLLLEARIAAQRLDTAEPLLPEVFRANPSNYSPVAAYTGACLAKKDYDAAFRTLRVLAPELVAARQGARLLESLRQIWLALPKHLPTLEMIAEVSERIGDDSMLPEVQEALGHAYTEAGDLEKAETCFRKLVARDPENEAYTDLLKQVLQKRGKQYVPANATALADREMALEPEAAETASGASGIDPAEAAAVKDAIDNSDLFARYNLTEKAVAELEKVLADYPNQVQIHQRILEVSQKTMRDRGAQAADALVRIYTESGDQLRAERYRNAAAALREGLEVPEQAEEKMAPLETSEPPPPSMAAPGPAEIDLSQEFAFSAPQEAEAEPALEVPLDLGASFAQSASEPAPAESEAPQPEAVAGLGPEAASPSGAVAEEKSGPFNFDEAVQEIDFYLQNGFHEEARKVVEGLEASYPGNPDVAKLAERVASRQPNPAAPAPEVAPPQSEPEAKAPVEAAPAPGPAATTKAGGDVLGSLASDLASSMGELEAPASKQAAQPASHQSKEGQPAQPSEAPSGIAQLSGLLDELGGTEEAQAQGEDPETHYNLGVAFREMGLLDEAIGEFQKVLREAQNGKYPPQFLQACTLLAASFTEKGMPAIAAKWLTRALETPGLDTEGTLAILYDLGNAYEQAGDARSALEKLTEVYSQNIDYRDVAEKIRILHQKAS